MRPKLLLYGAGGHGKVVADIVRRQGAYELAGFVDDSREGEFFGLGVLGTAEDLEKLRRSGIEHAIASVGDNRAREELDGRLLAAGFALAIAVHPSAQVAEGARLAPGTVVMPLAAIGPDAVLGRSCIVNTGASVDHDCILGDYVHVAPGSRLGGGVSVGARTLIGIGVAVNRGLRIGEAVVVSSGASVFTDIPSHARVARTSK